MTNEEKAEYYKDKPLPAGTAYTLPTLGRRTMECPYTYERHERYGPTWIGPWNGCMRYYVITRWVDWSSVPEPGATFEEMLAEVASNTERPPEPRKCADCAAMIAWEPERAFCVYCEHRVNLEALSCDYVENIPLSEPLEKRIRDAQEPVEETAWSSTHWEEL